MEIFKEFVKKDNEFTKGGVETLSDFKDSVF